MGTSFHLHALDRSQHIEYLHVNQAQVITPTDNRAHFDAMPWTGENETECVTKNKFSFDKILRKGAASFIPCAGVTV